MPGAAGAGCAPSVAAPLPFADGAAPAGGAAEAPSFNGFVDNGVPYAQQFAEHMQQRRQMGHTVPAQTPAMFAGEEGVSSDANGNFQLGEFGRFVVRVIYAQDRMASLWHSAAGPCCLGCPLTVEVLAAPPGYTPEEAVEIMKRESQILADMSPEVRLPLHPLHEHAGIVALEHVHCRQAKGS